MSHYSDCYYEANKDEFEREIKAERYRERMIDRLSMADMTRIMFTDFIAMKNNEDVIKIAEKYLGR